MNIIGLLRPIYPTIKRFCSLCGEMQEEYQYETQAARDMDARSKGGQIIVCNSCNEHAERIAQKASAVEAQMDADHEKRKVKILRELVEEELVAAGIKKGDKKKVKLPPKTKAGRIPNPKSN